MEAEIQVKRCSKCGKEKPLTEFYNHSKRKDGKDSRCKLCAQLNMQAWQKNNKQQFNKSSRNFQRKRIANGYKQDASYKAAHVKLFTQRYPEKQAARQAIIFAKKKRYIIPPTPQHQCHHWSYKTEHRLDVIFLTRQQHGKAHRFIVYDQERLMYRRTDTNELLDTRAKHEAYINFKIIHEED